ncbi:LOW QUALITY PROTEIN: uncharacterized protein si:ch211-214j8.12 [Notolabrus celidotus]|uniref:LOW QUALITY PROTEIN: uncharacterized protein si:ch211-214j8.12 n=1 Tax=Notolabrus celidotus TaxID=1203425 RepID=UPI00148FFB05|nr:LOW QUALITY PROTEIN: uncharacterized protein si:ch211-214j8.12 [Notolabrus celidotus]
MPLFRATGESSKLKAQSRRRRKVRGMPDDDGSVLSLTRLCLLNLSDNMKDVWAKDYADNYLDQYFFRHMGPFNLLPGELVEELTLLLCDRKQLSRAALHLLLVPQLRALSLEKCPGLATSALCSHIAARCQGLWSLDLSGAQQLPSKICQTPFAIYLLHSLSLAGTPCDECVIRTIALQCRRLRNLDISRCIFLSPAALLPLASCPAHFSSPSPLLSSALDIAFGEEEGDPVAAAAFLSSHCPACREWPWRVFAQACCLIQKQEFYQTYEFTDREGVPRLDELWRQRLDKDRGNKKREGERDEDEKVEILWEGSSSESEEDLNNDEGPGCSQSRAEEKRVLSQSGDNLILRLKDIRGLSCNYLGSVSQLCPNIHSISVNMDDDEDARGRSQGSLLAASLQTWSGQLRSLMLKYQGPLLDLLPALQVSGSSLSCLTLEGVKTSPHTPLLDIIRACPRLRDLIVSAEPSSMPQEEEEEEEGRRRRRRPTTRGKNRTIKIFHGCPTFTPFFYEHSQMKPVMSWMSLKKVLKCLLSGSPLLETLSLVSIPCPLNSVLQDVLRMVDMDLLLCVDSTDLPPIPLGRLQHIDLQRTDVKIATVESLMLQSKRLKCINVSYCWQISRLECLNCASVSKAQLVWS